VVRAWHRHLRGQVDYFFVARGYAKVCAYDDATGALVEVVLSGDKPQVLRVPGHYWHGFKALGHEPVYLVYLHEQALRLPEPRRGAKTLERPRSDPQDDQRQSRRPTRRKTLGLVPPTT
jgi:dTDP-4-dehydrorhamnose 3,5-epimerase